MFDVHYKFLDGREKGVTSGMWLSSTFLSHRTESLRTFSFSSKIQGRMNNWYRVYYLKFNAILVLFGIDNEYILLL